MRPDRRFHKALLVTLVITVLVAPTVPSFASGEDTKAADTAKKAPKAQPKAPTPAKAGDIEACPPSTKVNTFEDIFGARNWTLRAAVQPAEASPTIVWHEVKPVKPAPKSN